MLATKTLDGLIIKDPNLRGGRPILAGTGTTVRTIASLYKLGLSAEEITGELPLTLAQVYAALTYYHLHTDEIEADLQANAEAVLPSVSSEAVAHRRRVREALVAAGLSLPRPDTPPAVRPLSTEQREALAQRFGAGQPLSELIIKEREGR